MNCVAAEAAEEEPDGVAGRETVGAAVPNGGGAGGRAAGIPAGIPEDTHAMVSGTADGAEGIGGGAGGRVGGPEATHAMVSGTADGAGAAGSVTGGRVGGPAEGAGESAAKRRRAPHFSQNRDPAAF